MRILLVQSPVGRRELPIYPLGLAYLAGQLEHHLVEALDLSLHHGAGPEATLRGSINLFRPDVVAVSLRNIDDSAYPRTHSYMPFFAGLLDVLADWKGTVVAGGTGFSLYPDRILADHPRIDYGIPGEAEEILPLLLEHIETGGRGGAEGWDGSRLLPWGQVDLARIGPPAYDLVDPAPYADHGGIGVQSRRGCPLGCTYCTYGYLGGRAVRTRKVADVISDLEQLRSLGAWRFQFVDSIFNYPHDYFVELTEAIARADTGLRWGAWIDDTVTSGDLDLMVEAGAERVDFSPDAITERGLRMLGKRSHSGSLFPAVSMARARDLTVSVNFFNGNPGEGLGALLAKLLFMLRARLTLGWSRTYVNIGTIRVYAHSPLADRMATSGKVGRECDFYDPVFVRSRGPADWIYRLFMLVRRLRSRARAGLG